MLLPVIRSTSGRASAGPSSQCRDCLRDLVRGGQVVLSRGLAPAGSRQSRSATVPVVTSARPSRAGLDIGDLTPDDTRSCH